MVHLMALLVADSGRMING